MHFERGNKVITDFLKAYVYTGELLIEQVSSFYFFFNLIFKISNKYYKLGCPKCLFQDDMTSVCPSIYFEAQMYPKEVYTTKGTTSPHKERYDSVTMCFPLGICKHTIGSRQGKPSTLECFYRTRQVSQFCMLTFLFF